MSGSEALAERIAAIATDRKAQDVRVIDLRGIVSYTDFFVICSGNTERQTKAIHDAIRSASSSELSSSICSVRAGSLMRWRRPAPTLRRGSERR